MKRQHTPAYPPQVRRKMYFLLERAGWTAARVSKEYGISRKTLYKWRRKDRGDRTYRCRRPQPKLKLTNAIRIFIEREKRLTNPGPRKLSLVVKRRFDVLISTTVIYRFLKKRGLILRPQKKLPWYEPLKEPLVPKKPGDIVQMDAKYVWLDRERKYQRTFVDVYTGYHFATVVDTMEAKDTICAFEEAERAFPFQILGVQSDNGSENRGDFHQYLGEKGVAHYFIPKRSPQWNGAVERSHRSIDEEYYRNLNRPWHTLDAYLRWFNTERIHLGKYLNGLTPEEKWRQWREVSPQGVN